MKKKNQQMMGFFFVVIQLWLLFCMSNADTSGNLKRTNFLDVMTTRFIRMETSEMIKSLKRIKDIE